MPPPPPVSSPVLSRTRRSGRKGKERSREDGAAQAVVTDDGSSVEVLLLLTTQDAKAEADAEAATEKAAMEAAAEEEAAAREAEKAKEVKYMQWLSEAVGTFESIGGCISVYQLVSPDSPFDLSKIPTGKKGDVRRILRSLHRVLTDLRQYVMTIPEQGNETPARTRT